MTCTRREFLASSAAFATTTAVLPQTLEATAAPATAQSSLRILILGGTGFLGPACTESALGRGHRVTHFNSGRTEERRRDAGRASVVPSGVEQLYGNRDPNKTADDRKTEGQPSAPKDPKSPKGLTQLEGKSWDAVIDTSGYFPRMVKASAELLAPHIQQYVFISTISVYRDNSKLNFDETAPLCVLENPAIEEMGKDAANYGGAKALCEQAAETALPGKVTNIRPGYIVGPRDTSGRFLYWPVRASLGGTMIVPGSPTDPIQLIDVRDLSDWIIHCIEQRVVGTFNATGPARELAMKAMVEGVRTGVGSRVEFTWVDGEFLRARGVSEGQFPLYVPPTGETAGFHRCNVSRALANGLKFRPVSDTAKASLDWYQALPADLQPRIVPQFAKKGTEEPWLEVERRTLEAWKSREGKQPASR